MSPATSSLLLLRLDNMGHENTDTASELREPQTQKEFKARVTAYRNIGLSALSQNLHDFAKGKFEELINETLSCVDRGRTKSDWPVATKKAVDSAINVLK
ncbi:hypothetical protein M3Y99_01767800 [Aphelenchoides fujianensis]|nr:hypothetical protein M3Y99_01767800 [Aphelenchoides fujianensis]